MAVPSVDKQSPVVRSFMQVWGVWTPTSTGADTLVLPLPYTEANESLRWALRRVWFRTGTTGTTGSTVSMQYSDSEQLFEGRALATVTVPAGLYLVDLYGQFGTAYSGNMVRAYVDAIGSSSANWEIVLHWVEAKVK